MRFLRELLGLPKRSGHEGTGGVSRPGDRPPIEISREAFLTDPQRFLIHSRKEGPVFVRDREGDICLVLGSTGIQDELAVHDDPPDLLEDDSAGSIDHDSSWLD